MRDKHYVLVASSFAGIVGAAAVYHWPNDAQLLQMTLYSIVVIGGLLWGAWHLRSRPNFLIAIAVMAMVHCFVLIGAKDIFPFRTIVLMVPVALSEMIITFTIMLKIVDF